MGQVAVSNGKRRHAIDTNDGSMDQVASSNGKRRRHAVIDTDDDISVRTDLGRIDGGTDDDDDTDDDGGSVCTDLAQLSINDGDIHGGDDVRPEAPSVDDCAVCTERLEWVAVGRCGHSKVCAKCAVQLRFVHGDHRCCICRRFCPTVVVTKADGDGDGVFARVQPRLAVFHGRVGKHWYHNATTAYFDDKRLQYKAAIKACAGDEVTSEYRARRRFCMGCFS